MQAGGKALEAETTLYEAILEDIARGNLKGGDRLKVSALAKQYGQSASPIREVLRRMQGEGFVKILHNKGAVIVAADALTIQNIFEVLQLLEPYFVGWFAEYALPEMLEELDAVHQKILDAPKDDLYLFRQLDTEFHYVICKHHYNDAAADTWKRLRTALSVHASRLRISPQRIQTIIEEHARLIAACKANDSEAALEIITQHVNGSFHQMSQQMRAIGI
ncbi:GntR family transcriptional regulator [Epibacterium ulvae]|uniref:GntR family transcriptional regulator n=1 Tax=Epibacterium ulvae TaxID=1156985 RepID=UPI002492B0A7|nr:GntR family transcriptional regulator [Epibacterium ulvae]